MIDVAAKAAVYGGKEGSGLAQVFETPDFSEQIQRGTKQLMTVQEKKQLKADKEREDLIKTMNPKIDGVKWAEINNAYYLKGYDDIRSEFMDAYTKNGNKITSEMLLKATGGFERLNAEGKSTNAIYDEVAKEKAAYFGMQDKFDPESYTKSMDGLKKFISRDIDEGLINQYAETNGVDKNVAKASLEQLKNTPGWGYDPTVNAYYRKAPELKQEFFDLGKAINTAVSGLKVEKTGGSGIRDIGGEKFISTSETEKITPERVKSEINAVLTYPKAKQAAEQEFANETDPKKKELGFEGWMYDKYGKQHAITSSMERKSHFGGDGEGKDKDILNNMTVTNVSRAVTSKDAMGGEVSHNVNGAAMSAGVPANSVLSFEVPFFRYGSNVKEKVSPGGNRVLISSPTLEKADYESQWVEGQKWTGKEKLEKTKEGYFKVTTKPTINIVGEILVDKNDTPVEEESQAKGRRKVILPATEENIKKLAAAAKVKDYASYKKKVQELEDSVKSTTILIDPKTWKVVKEEVKASTGGAY